MTEIVFLHLEGKFSKEEPYFKCGIFNCDKRNCFEFVSDEKILEFKKTFETRYLNNDFIDKFSNTQSTSPVESWHSSSFSQFVNKNVPMNVKTRTTESRFSVSVINHNEGLQGYLEQTNQITEIQGWLVSEFSIDRLVRLSINKNSQTDLNYYKKKIITCAKFEKKFFNQKFCNL